MRTSRAHRTARAATALTSGTHDVAGPRLPGDDAGVAGVGDRPHPEVRLSMREVTKWYGRLRALDQITLSVHHGEIVAVVGENGAGKSTLVSCIAGYAQIDGGRIDIRPARERAGTAPPQIAVTWQDLGLCEDLDVVANIFLGREHTRGLLAENRMATDARNALDRFGSQLSDVRARVDTLSRGERQEVALARAIATEAELLVLDEPTASLSAMRRAAVVELLRELRDAGQAILLVSHDLEEVFLLADRILVLRHGRIVATVSPAEVHVDDVAALMSGIESESTARRQLNRLKSLVEQLSAADPAASLPLVVSATAAALDQDMLCVHLLEPTPGGTVLRRTAAIGLPDPLVEVTLEVAPGSAGGLIGTAAATGQLVVVDDASDDPAWSGFFQLATAAGVRSGWSTPIIGSTGVLGTITGFSTSAGRLDPDRAELVSLYAGHAATAIEREQLIDEVSRRNEILESLRAMLESLAGPDRVDGGLSVALLALCRGLGASAVGVLVAGVPEVGGAEPSWVEIDLDGASADRLRELAEQAASSASDAQRLSDGLAVAGLPLPEGQGILISQWADQAEPGRDRLELLDDARRSLALALEREGLERARREATAARRSQHLQRELLQQLSHELRTPLTAIRGYGSTLLQPDLTWDAASVERFLTAITTESARMERLVDDLLDSSAIESGVLSLRRDWTDLRLVLEAARSCVPDRDRIRIRAADDLEPIWADHDRLEQVFVNLLENAVRHGDPHGEVRVTAARGVASATMEVLISDDGDGVPPDVVDRLFEPRVRHKESTGAGLGLSIARGITEAHGGSCELLPGSPTTFRVTVPIEPVDFDPVERPSADAPGVSRHG
ncbi:ATP-binding cassette domain-containing protein [Phytoactinopolyspora mesophila]|uniref:histidine kinase n=1 Tax=Phytoactinopolyspora mesophila TaxID=2650750 RepID=A0A7K3LXM8_9ACTN|nr:ATP-binding cassette domain-containing protein [Phytoactinopolyspora mesophila]NDL55784.1 ATP-binding cassette domain-containing protein [Phytoactinopolyspora mesophila]